jgi:hypothetical protein
MENEDQGRERPSEDGPAATSASEQSICPHCKRRLLSLRSILCNWCGKRIDDPEYLQRAAHERAVEDAKLRDQVEQEQHETARMGILGRLKGKSKVTTRKTSFDIADLID